MSIKLIIINHKENRKTIAMSNEKGIILIIVLVMLLLLSILGSFVLTSTTSELRISGNYRNTQEAFYNTDGSIEYLLANYNHFLTATDSTPITSVVYQTNADSLPLDATSLPPGATLLSNVTTQYLFDGAGGLEPGNSQDVKTYHYAVTMLGQRNNAEVSIEAEIGKVDYESGGNVLYN